MDEKGDDENYRYKGGLDDRHDAFGDFCNDSFHDYKILSF